MNEKQHKVFQNGFEFILNEEDKSASIAQTEFNTKEYIIPRSVKYETQEYIITSITERALEYSFQKSFQFPPNSEIQSFGQFSFFASQITSILIPSSVICICKFAFGLCHKLEKVDFVAGSKLQIIEKGAFDSSNIKYLSIPSSVVELKEGWCNCLMDAINITITQNEIQNISVYDEKFIIGKTDPKSDIFDSLIYLLKDIENVTIPSFIKRIASSAFLQRSNLKSIEFDENTEIQIIESNAFAESSLKSLTIPSSIAELKEKWCAFTKELTDITIIQKEIQNISLYDEKFILGKTDTKSENFDILLFSRRDIEYARIPSFIKQIAPYSFDKCHNLKSIHFESNSNLQTIGKYAFNSTSLAEIVIPSSVVEIQKGTFRWCNSLQKVEFEENSKLQEIGQKTFCESAIENITIPSNVTQINRLVFGYCHSLQKVEFSADSKIQTFEKSAFTESSIRSLTIPSSIAELKEKWCVRTKELADIKIIQKEIQNISFYDEKFILGKTDTKSENFDILLFSRRDIEYARIPSFIKQIAPYSFSYCERLKSIEFDDNSNLNVIEKYAFDSSSIPRILIPSHVTRICDRAFISCQQLRTVEFANDSEMCVIEEGAFNETSIERILIPSHVTQIGRAAFLRCKKLTEVDFAEDPEIQSIEELAFASTSIGSIRAPKNLMKIETSAFDRCKNLQVIEIDDNLKVFSILKQIKLPSDVQIMISNKYRDQI